MAPAQRLKHVSVAVLLGLLVWKLLRDRVAALLAGALFALHPAQAESVAWISVPDSLMSVAILGSLLLYLQYIQRESPTGQTQTARSHRKSRKQVKGQTSRPSAVWLYASAAACLAAMMAKETAIVLPAIFFAVALITPVDSRRDAAPAKHGIHVRMVSALRETLPFLVATLIYLLLRLQRSGRPDQSSDSAFALEHSLAVLARNSLVLSEGAALACTLLRVRGSHSGRHVFAARCRLAGIGGRLRGGRPRWGVRLGLEMGPAQSPRSGERPESSARCCWEPYSWCSRSF